MSSAQIPAVIKKHTCLRTVLTADRGALQQLTTFFSVSGESARRWSTLFRTTDGLEEEEEEEADLNPDEEDAALPARGAVLRMGAERRDPPDA